MHTLARAAVDLVAVGAFAAIGRSSHQEALELTGIVTTAGPFWLGAAAGWAVCQLGLKKTLLGEGLVVWGSTLVLGHLIRALFGPGTAVSFVIVSAIALAVLLLGWRGIYALLTRRRG